jgi:hypothetical protein
VQFKVEDIPVMPPDHWEFQEWLYYANSMYLVKVPVKAEVFYALAYHVMIDGVPLSIKMMERDMKIKRLAAEGIQRFVLRRGFAQWRSHEKRQGIRLTEDGERMMWAASRKHYSALPQHERAIMRKRKPGDVVSSGHATQEKGGDL